MVREERGGVRGAVRFPVSRRREKAPIRPRGEVRPAPGSCARAQAGNQARDSRRRETRAGGRGRPRRIARELGSRRIDEPVAGRAERSGTERNEGAIFRRRTNTASAGGACRHASASPAGGLPDSHISFPSATAPRRSDCGGLRAPLVAPDARRASRGLPATKLRAHKAPDRGPPLSRGQAGATKGGCRPGLPEMCACGPLLQAREGDRQQPSCQKGLQDMRHSHAKHDTP